MPEPEVQVDPVGPAPAQPLIGELSTTRALLALAVLTLAMFFDVLFVHTDRVLSSGAMDLNIFFIHWIHFTVGELTHGHLALWNPHYFSGAPFMGGFQPGILYPLNLLYLVLPMVPAINWTIALHIFLSGAFTYFWTRNRGLHSWACLLAAMMFMFCGPHFFHVYAGHLPNLCTMIWAPLLFLAIDRLFDRPSLGPCLLGGFAVAMAVLAGHPQYVFFLGVGAAVYCLLNLAMARERGKIAAGLVVICLLGVGLSAAQLFTGVQESKETLRSLGVSYSFACTFSFPPENFLTLLTPWLFGDIENSPYWGRWHMTEMSLFVSVTGLVLAVYGVARGRRETRRFAFCTLIAVLIFASGSYTPLFPFLYHYAPGFNKFRGFAKFVFLAGLFLAMLAAIGLDALIKQARTPRWLIGLASGLALATGLVAVWLPTAGWWPGALKWVESTTQTVLAYGFVEDPAVVAETREFAMKAFATSAASFGVLAFMLMLSNRARALACRGIVGVAAVELFVFASHSLTTFQIAPPYPDFVANCLKANPGDYRVLAPNPNCAMTANAQDIWGDDPQGLLRYARFLGTTKGYDFDKMTIETKATITNSAPWGLMRCRYVFSEDFKSISEIANPLPHVLLVNQCRIMTNRYDILYTLTNSAFPRRQEVILETRPDPYPAASTNSGTARLLDFNADSLTIEADVAAPALLLVTDTYSSGWRALPLAGSSQSSYEILPGDYFMRAVPLAAGHHRILMEYSPVGFRVGRAVSLVTLLIFGACVLVVRARRRDDRNLSNC
jgi:hypothetical protein